MADKTPTFTPDPYAITTGMGIDERTGQPPVSNPALTQGVRMPNADGSPSKGEPGYLAPDSGLLTVGTAGPNSNVAAYTPSTATATPAAASTYDPSKYVMTPDQTVEGRAAKIAGEDSPLMQQARVRANQDAQAKGLLSSSLAVGSGQNAVLEKAVPIASQDAAAYNAAMTNTANAENTAKQFNAGTTTDVSKTNAGLLTTVSQGNAEMANTQKNTASQAFNQQAFQYVDNTTKTALATLSSQNAQLLQSNASASAMFQDTVKNIAGIAVDATLSKEAKDAATQSQLNLLSEGLRTTGGIATTVPAEVHGLNLGQYFQSDSGAAFTPEQQKQNLTNDIAALQAQYTDVANNGTGVPVLEGENASERRVPLWNAALANIQTQIRAAQEKLTALTATPATPAPVTP